MPECTLKYGSVAPPPPWPHTNTGLWETVSFQLPHLYITQVYKHLPHHTVLPPQPAMAPSSLRWDSRLTVQLPGPCRAWPLTTGCNTGFPATPRTSQSFSTRAFLWSPSACHPWAHISKPCSFFLLPSCPMAPPSGPPLGHSPHCLPGWLQNWLPHCCPL